MSKGDLYTHRSNLLQYTKNEKSIQELLDSLGREVPKGQAMDAHVGMLAHHDVKIKI